MMISAAITFVVVQYVSSTRRAIIRSATLSAMLLEWRAYQELDGFDLGFFAILTAISTASAAIVVVIVRSFRRSRRIVI
jgi:hypothetical protein